MGLWFFLSVMVVGQLAYRAYKINVLSRANRAVDGRVESLELELKAIREKIQHLDEAVFFGDFELKRQFKELEQEIKTERKP